MRRPRPLVWGYILATQQQQRAEAAFHEAMRAGGWGEESEALLRDRDAWGAVLALLEVARPVST